MSNNVVNGNRRVADEFIGVQTYSQMLTSYNQEYNAFRMQQANFATIINAGVNNQTNQVTTRLLEINNQFRPTLVSNAAGQQVTPLQIQD